MSNILYNKWRPKKFKDILNQNLILEYLLKSLFKNKLHHSYLFIGNKGTGKTTIARLFVKLLNCKYKNNIIYNNKLNFNLPCNKCLKCILIDKKNCFPDFIEIDAANKSSIEDIKNIIENIQYYPINSEYKIYIIDEIHILSKQGFSALLKTLEEPPIYLIFILITTELSKIPETLISRCVTLNFKNISISNIIKKIKIILDYENIKYNINILNKIAIFSNGSLRDSLNILEKFILLSDKDNIIFNNNLINDILEIYDYKFIFNIIKIIIINNNDFLFYYINKIDIDINYNTFFDQFLLLLHNIIMYGINSKYVINPIFNNYLKNIKFLLKCSKIFKFIKLYKLIIKNINNNLFLCNNKLRINLFIIYIFYNINNIN